VWVRPAGNLRRIRRCMRDGTRLRPPLPALRFEPGGRSFGLVDTGWGRLWHAVQFGEVAPPSLDCDRSRKKLPIIPLCSCQGEFRLRRRIPEHALMRLEDFGERVVGSSRTSTGPQEVRSRWGSTLIGSRPTRSAAELME